jgi:hypothetical protein
MYWKAGLHVDVVRNSSRNPEAFLGKLGDGDTIYTGDNLTITVITPAGTILATDIPTEVTITKDNYAAFWVAVDTTDTSAGNPQFGFSQEIILPSGDTIFARMESADDSIVFDADIDLQVICDGQHRGGYDVDVEYLTRGGYNNEPRLPIHFYDYNSYLDDFYNSRTQDQIEDESKCIMGRGGEVEAEYLMQKGRYLGSIFLGDGQEIGRASYWYVTYFAELAHG